MAELAGIFCRVDDMGTPLTTRVVLKVRRIIRELDPAEREFQRIWPLVNPIEGWLLEGQERWLFGKARSMPDGANIVEVGSYKGRSTCCLGFGCRISKKRVYAVDSFDGGADLPRQDSLAEFRQNVAHCGLGEHIVPIAGISADVSRTWERPIHFLFIDGSHLYEDVMTDFSGFFPHVVPGGLVAFHDVHESHPGVLRAWQETIRGQLTDVDFCSTIGFGKKARRPKARIR